MDGRPLRQRFTLASNIPLFVAEAAGLGVQAACSQAQRPANARAIMAQGRVTTGRGVMWRTKMKQSGKRAAR